MLPNYSSIDALLFTEVLGHGCVSNLKLLNSEELRTAAYELALLLAIGVITRF